MKTMNGSAETLEEVPPLGVVDRLGYLVCRHCHEQGIGRGRVAVVTGPPHSDERCDFCASILANQGEP